MLDLGVLGVCAGSSEAGGVSSDDLRSMGTAYAAVDASTITKVVGDARGLRSDVSARASAVAYSIPSKGRSSPVSEEASGRETTL